MTLKKDKTWQCILLNNCYCCYKVVHLGERLNALKERINIVVKFQLQVFIGRINLFHATGLFQYPLKTSENFQKQLFTDVLQNSCSWKFREIHRKAPVLESGLKACNFFEKIIQHRWFPVIWCTITMVSHNKNIFSINLTCIKKLA